MSDVNDMLDCYDDWFLEPDDPHVHACNRCGEEDLRWARWPVGGKLVWRLVNEDNDLHVCRPPTADDYDDLDE